MFNIYVYIKLLCCNVYTAKQIVTLIAWGGAAQHFETENQQLIEQLINPGMTLLDLQAE